MRKIFTLIFPILMAGTFVSCQKSNIDEPVGKEIVLHLEDDQLGTSVETKTTAVTSIPSSLYWGGTTGSGGSQSAKWASASGTVSSSKISTGKFQTATATTYNYYVSNVNMSIGANTTVSATGGTSGTDVICGYTAGTNSATPSVTLNHIFARTGTITTSTSAGSLSNVSYTIVRGSTSVGTSGTYNLRTGAWSSASGLSSDTSISGSSDMYLIPGAYTIKVTATYTRGDYQYTATKSGSATLAAGKINNITLNWPAGGTEIQVTVSLSGWGSTTASTNIS